MHSMVAGQLLANGAGWAGLTVIFIFIKDTVKFGWFAEPLSGDPEFAGFLETHR